MPCRVKRIDGTPVSVETESGQDSQLFNSLASNPHFTQEKAFDFYKNIHTNRFKEQFGDWEKKGTPVEETDGNDIDVVTVEETTDNQDVVDEVVGDNELDNESDVGWVDQNGEPQLLYQADGIIAAEFKEALDSTTGEIEVGFVGKGGFIPLSTINATNDNTSFQGFVNNAIRDNRIEPKKELRNGVYRFVGSGTGTTSIYNASTVTQEATELFGARGNRTYDDGSFTLQFNDKTKTTVVDKDGNEKQMSFSEILSEVETRGVQSFFNKYQNGTEVYMLATNAENPPSQQKSTEQRDTKSDLVSKLLGMLRRSGIEQTTIDNYARRYEQINGIPPTAEALVDLNRGIIAFAEGKVTEDNVLEEFVHLVIAATVDKTTLLSLSQEIQNTPEYQENQQRYREVYSKNNNDPQSVEEQVLEEVLGKILKKKVKDNFDANINDQTNQPTYSSRLLQTLRDYLNKFIELIRSNFTQNQASQLEQFTDRLAELSLNEEIVESLKNYPKDSRAYNRALLFSLAPETRKTVKFLMEKTQQLEKLSSVVRRAERNLKVGDSGTKAVQTLKQIFKDKTGKDFRNFENAQQVMDVLNEEQSNALAWRGLVELVGVAATTVREARKDIIDSTSSDNTAELSQAEKQTVELLNGDLNNLVLNVQKGIKELTIHPTLESQINKDRLQKQIDFYTDTVKEINERVKGFDTSDTAREIRQNSSGSGTAVEEARAERVEGEKDLEINWLNKWVGFLKDSPNSNLRALGTIIYNMLAQVTMRTNAETQWFVKKWSGILDINKSKEITNVKEDGTLGNHYEDMYDRDKHRDELDMVDFMLYQVFIINNPDIKTKNKPENVKQYLKMKRSGALLDPQPNLSPNLWVQYTTAKLELERGLRETYFEESRYEQVKEDLEQLAKGINGATPKYKSLISPVLTELRKKVQNNEGIRAVLEEKLEDGFSQETVQLANQLLTEANGEIQRLNETAKRKLIDRLRREGANEQTIKDNQENPDRSQYDKADLARIQTAKLRKNELAAYVDYTGQTKEGDALETAIAIRAINELNRQRIVVENGNKEQQIVPEFYKRLSELPDDQKFAYFQENAPIVFNDNYWETVTQQAIDADSALDGLVTELKKRLSQTPSTETTEIERIKSDISIFENLVKEKRRLKLINSEMMRRNRNPNNPSEIVANMDSPTKRVFLENEDDITTANRGIRAILRKYGAEPEAGTGTISENTTNQAYEIDKANAGVQDGDKAAEFRFAYQNISESRQQVIDRMMFVVKQMVENASKNSAYTFDVTALDKNEEIISLIEAYMGKPDGTFATGQEAYNEYSKYTETTEGTTTPQEILLPAVKNRLGVYYKRIAPAGYDALLQDLQQNPSKIDAVVKELSQTEVENRGLEFEGVKQFLTIRADYGWTESANNLKRNENYIDTFKGIQPKRNPRVVTGIGTFKLNKGGTTSGSFQTAVKKDYFVSKKYASKYGITIDQYLKAKGEVKATRNQKDYELLQDIRRFIGDINTNYGSPSADDTLVPQLSKGVVERALGFVSSPKKTLVNIAKDIGMNRVDEKEEGEMTEDGQNIKDITGLRKIPKLYQRRLEDTDDVSREYGMSLMMMYKESVRYQERKNIMPDVIALESDLMSTEFTRAKGSGISNALAMFREHVDAHVFGIKINNKVSTDFNLFGLKLNGASLAKFFNMRSITRAVGFNWVLDGTSAMSGHVQLFKEAGVEEFMLREDLTKAGSKAMSGMGRLFSEAGKLNKSSLENAILETAGLSSLRERFETAGYKRALRIFDNAPFFVANALNAPPQLLGMYGVMNGLRVVNEEGIADGQVLSWQDYANLKRKKNNKITKKEILAHWKAYQNQSIDNYLKGSDNAVIEFKENNPLNPPSTEIQKLKDKNLSKAEYDKQLKALKENYQKEVINRTTRKIATLLSYIDGRINTADMNTASRNVFFQFIMGLKGWFFIDLQRRFRGRIETDPSTGLTAEGHWITMARMIKETVGQVYTQKDAAVIMDVWNDMQDWEKTNIKRNIIDQATLITMMTIGMLVRGIADDDDNEDSALIQLASLIYFRTVAEQSNLQINSAHQTLADVISSPIVAARNFKDIVSAKGWSFDEIEQGNYKGYPKVVQTLAKQTYGKHFFDLKDPRAKNITYRNYNTNYLNYAFGLLSLEVEKDD